jgi:hypothetical protein
MDRRGWLGHVPAILSLEGEQASIVQEAGQAPEPAWTGTENLAPTGIRLPDRPAIPTDL